MIDFKNKDCIELHSLIESLGHYCYQLDNEWVVSDLEFVQEVIDNFTPSLPDLTPRQFKYMLASTGIDISIDRSLEKIRSVNLEIYAQIVSQLYGGTVYFWDKSLSLCNQIKLILLQDNPNLNLDEENLKIIWLLASKI